MPQISYIFFPGNGGAPIELGDDAIGNRVSGGLPAQKRQIEKVPGAFAATNKRFDRGNAEESITWSVDRNHATLLAAFLFRRDHADSIPKGVASGVLQELEEESNSSRFLQDCCIESITCTQLDGASEVFQYTASGSEWTDTLN